MNEAEIKGKLKAYAEILNSLYSAGIVRTYNSPVGYQGKVDVEYY